MSDRKPPTPKAIVKAGALPPSSDPAWSQALPATRILPPVVSTLDTLHEASQTLADRMQVLIAEAPTELTPVLAKTLLTLAQTVSSIHATKKAARDDTSELDDMSEEELDAALERAIEERRRKRLGLPIDDEE